MAFVGLAYALAPLLWALAATIPCRTALTGLLWALIHLSATGALLLWMRVHMGGETAGTLTKLLTLPLLAGGSRLVYEIHQALTGGARTKP